MIGPRVQTAVGVRQKSAHFAVQRAHKMPLRVAVLEYLGQVVRDQRAAPFGRGQRVQELDRQAGDLRDLAEREAVDAELGVVERHAQPAVAGELQGVRLDDEVLRLMIHHMLDDLARVLAAVLDQPVEFRDCLVLVHGQHLRSLFPLPDLSGRFVLRFTNKFLVVIERV